VQCACSVIQRTLHGIGMRNKWRTGIDNREVGQVFCGRVVANRLDFFPPP
jgi:hypothetical protein